MEKLNKVAASFEGVIKKEVEETIKKKDFTHQQSGEANGPGLSYTPNPDAPVRAAARRSSSGIWERERGRHKFTITRENYRRFCTPSLLSFRARCQPPTA